jgi:hypothetical protein
MKKIFLISFAIVGLFGLFMTNNIVFGQTYSAQSGATQLCQGSSCPITSVEGIFGILKTVVQWTYTIFFAVAVLIILIAAFNFLTAQGDPTKINSAKSQIMWACVAIAIALIAVGAAQIIQGLITNK